MLRRVVSPRLASRPARAAAALLVGALSALGAPGGCASAPPTTSAPTTTAPPTPVLDVPPVAVAPVEGDAAAAPALTAHLRDTLIAVSGAPAIDRFTAEESMKDCGTSVEAEAIEECTSPEMRAFLTADIMVASRVGTLGETAQAFVTVTRRNSVVARTSGSGPTAAEALTVAARDAGRVIGDAAREQGDFAKEQP